MTNCDSFFWIFDKWFRCKLPKNHGGQHTFVLVWNTGDKDSK